ADSGFASITLRVAEAVSVTAQPVGVAAGAGVGAKQATASDRKAQVVARRLTFTWTPEGHGMRAFRSIRHSREELEHGGSEQGWGREGRAAAGSERGRLGRPLRYMA